ncbi:mg19 protein [Tupanvirus deep ocean]|uniref:Mg19 protein n=2 Tax=Tupanvirus TaxID=2094720 RepID=A0AC62A6R1_9VIRU|nr:mg19 protein [Tupanvirus deep ocean]QKU33461.1 mg19 protein [Tupanvirus deep ocean]
MDKCIVILIIIIITLLITYLFYKYFHKNIYSTADVINSFFEKNCDDPAVFSPMDFPWSQNFRNHWVLIKEEFLNYSNKYVVPEHNKINKIAASCDNNNKWKTLYLRIFGKNTKVADFFPITMSLINMCPCTLAHFSVLGPRAKLTPHVGIYKGVLRYHLGLIVPKEWNECFINVNGINLYWTEGNDIMFDDMFMHHVENNTDETRVILFLDIKRDFKNPFVNLVNDFFLKFVKSNDILDKTITNVNNFSSNYAIIQ